MEHQIFSGFSTQAIHEGQAPDPHTGAVIPPISLSTTFAQSAPGIHQGFEYARTDNPTRRAYETCLARLEKGTAAISFSSGLAAIDALMRLFDPPIHIVCFDDMYGGTFRLFQFLEKQNILTFTQADLTDPTAFEKACTKQTRLLWIETPSNPLLKICDIAALSSLAHQKNISVAVDNTFATPFFQNPLEHRADFVIHSATKYLNGHSDVINGAVIVKNALFEEKLRFIQNALGAIPSPFDCFLILRGLKTLSVRMQAHEKNSFQLSAFLESHPKVQKVLYPGLSSHPQHAISKTQMKGFGGMLSVVLKGTLDQTKQFLSHLNVFTLAESLGGVESLIEHPALMTHAAVPKSTREQLGISDSLIRLSVGIEDPQDLIHDLERAFHLSF